MSEHACKLNVVHAIADEIVERCAEPLCFEQTLQKLLATCHLIMTFEQNVLVGSAVESYLSRVKAENRLDIVIENKPLLWSYRPCSMQRIALQK